MTNFSFPQSEKDFESFTLPAIAPAPIPDVTLEQLMAENKARKSN